MKKNNYMQTVERNKLFLKRQLMDGILFKADIQENPHYIHEERDSSWGDRECLSLSDPAYVLRRCHQNTKIYKEVDDDTIPWAYPTCHFGEAFYSAILGGEIQFVGNGYNTCSGAKPVVHTIEDLEKLQNYKNNYWVGIFADSAKHFAKEANGDFWLQYLITIDALNLAVELLGSTEAYYMLYEDVELVKNIMEFGIDFNNWFYLLQKDIYEKNNRIALADDELYELYDKTWYSIDAYDICDPAMYKVFGMEYQQELISKVGGGKLHTHGTGLLRLLPHISQLKGLSVMQIGRDLYSGEWLEFEHLADIRKQTGDIPLSVYVSPQEFLDGIKNKTLPGGVEYCCSVCDVEEANRLAYMAKEYRV